FVAHGAQRGRCLNVYLLRFRKRSICAISRSLQSALHQFEFLCRAGSHLHPLRHGLVLLHPLRRFAQRHGRHNSTNYPCQPVEFAAQSAGAALGLVEFLLHLAGAAIDLAHSFAETTQRRLSLPHLPQQGVQVRVYVVINRTERFSHVSCPASRSPSPASPCCQCTVFRLSTQRRTCPAGICCAAPPAGRSWSGSMRLPRTYPDALWPWRQTWPRRTRAWVRP